jgi:hypothetical protein
MGELQNLTQTMDGAYTYCRRGLTSEFFPDTFFKESGAASGWIPFAEGTLTNRRSDFVIWDGRTVAGSGVDIIFDLGSDCWLDEVLIHYVRLKGYGCGLGDVSVSVRANAETRFHAVKLVSPLADDQAAIAPWLRLAGLNTLARYIRLHVEPSGQSLYANSSIGLVAVELRGLPLEKKRTLDMQPRPYPWPAELTWSNNCFTFGPETGVVVAEESRFAAEWLRDELMARFGLVLPINVQHKSGIRLTPSAALDAEGYRLSVQAGEISIEGGPVGIFYGVLTLLQLVKRQRGQLEAPAVLIVDRPLAAIRGLHVYLPSRENILYFKRLLDFMASLKLNTAVIEVGAGMRYQRHPEINSAWEKFTRQIKDHLDKGKAALLGDPNRLRRWLDSMHIELAGGSFLEQEEVRDLVEYARQRHITPIPEVQTLSHCYWILQAHPELSERDDTPFPDTYCPSHPDVYPLVFDLMDEVLAVFEPPAVLIGHDEAWAVGICPRCSRRSATDLFAEDITKLHDHLAKHHAQTWMWADTLDPNFFGWAWVRKELGVFLQSPATHGLLDILPKDILAVNWHWGHTWSHEEAPQVLEGLIHRAGLPQIYGNFEAAFCQDYAGRARAAGISGAIMPSWVANAESDFGRNGVIHNLIFSANALWSHHYQGRRTETIQEVIARIPAARSRLLDIPSPMLTPGASFTPISLANHVNAPLADPSGALGEYDLRAIPSGDLLLDGLPFQVPDPAAHGGCAAAAVQGPAVRDRLYPAQVTGIAAARRAASLVFLHVASDSADAVLDWHRCDNPIFMGLPPESRQTLGLYRMNYEDGTKAEVTLRYDEHLARWNTRFGERSIAPYRADPAWQGNTGYGTPITLWRFEWINPHPAKVIESVDLLAADGSDAAILLLAITAVETREGNH